MQVSFCPRAHSAAPDQMKIRFLIIWSLLIAALTVGTTAQAALTIDYPATTRISQFTFNGDAVPLTTGAGIVPSLQLTSLRQFGRPNDPNYDPNVIQAGAVFYNTPVNVSAFATTFRFKLTPDPAHPENPWGDGITFTVQNQGTSAQGDGGSGLGYSGISSSVALKFKTAQLAFANGPADPSRSTVSVLVNGEYPIGAGISLTDLLRFGSDFDLGSGATFRADVTYRSSSLVLKLTNENTTKSVTLTFAVNIPAYVGGNTALAGFTGSTGLFVADQRILSWQYTEQGTSNDKLRPVISSITPATVLAGSGATSMTILGAGFTSGQVQGVYLNGTLLPTTSVSANEVDLILPANLLTTPRIYNVIVLVSGALSNAVPFTVARTQTIAAPQMQINRDIFYTGVDEGGARYTVLAIRNVGSAPITNVSFTNLLLDLGNGVTAGGFLEAIEAGGSPGASLSSIPVNGFVRARFKFNTLRGGESGFLSVRGTSNQGAFNAGSIFLIFP